MKERELNLKVDVVNTPVTRSGNLSKTEKALLFGAFYAVTRDESAVQSKRLPSQIQKKCFELYKWAPSTKTVKKWACVWIEHDFEFVEDTLRSCSYNSKRKRIGGEISQQFKEKKSCREVALEAFDDNGTQVTVCHQTAYNAAKNDLGLKPSAPKLRRIITFTPHHARAALTVCAAALEMERAFQENVSAYL